MDIYSTVYIHIYIFMDHIIYTIYIYIHIIIYMSWIIYINTILGNFNQPVKDSEVTCLKKIAYCLLN